MSMNTLPSSRLVIIVTNFRKRGIQSWRAKYVYCVWNNGHVYDCFDTPTECIAARARRLQGGRTYAIRCLLERGRACFVFLVRGYHVRHALMPVFTVQTKEMVQSISRLFHGEKCTFANIYVRLQTRTRREKPGKVVRSSTNFGPYSNKEPYLQTNQNRKSVRIISRCERWKSVGPRWCTTKYSLSWEEWEDEIGGRPSKTCYSVVQTIRREAIC
eukprot:scaffold102_cov340-Pavlova_lutheri.AAC.75